MWEAPQKGQQVWFIKHFGSNVNLGNIAPNDVIPLETLRLGLRGDTFFTFLDPEKKKPIVKL
jgi:phosphosulfolactate synthase